MYVFCHSEFPAWKNLSFQGIQLFLRYVSLFVSDGKFQISLLKTHFLLSLENVNSSCFWGIKNSSFWNYHSCSFTCVCAYTRVRLFDECFPHFLNYKSHKGGCLVFPDLLLQAEYFHSSTPFMYWSLDSPDDGTQKLGLWEIIGFERDLQNATPMMGLVYL